MRLGRMRWDAAAKLWAEEDNAPNPSPRSGDREVLDRDHEDDRISKDCKGDLQLSSPRSGSSDDHLDSDDHSWESDMSVQYGSHKEARLAESERDFMKDRTSSAETVPGTLES